MLCGVAAIVLRSPSGESSSTGATPRAGLSTLATARVQMLRTASGINVAVLGGSPGRWRVITPCDRTATIATGTPIRDIRVIIDPGHGGAEVGAVTHGLEEARLNLQVAVELQHQLQALGITAALTRTGDYRLPIATRAAIANAVAPALFVSVHHNAGAAAPHQGPGTEVYYQHQSPAAKRLAGLVWASVFSTLQSFGVPWVGASDAGAIYRLGSTGNDFYGVLRLTHVPAVLIEPAYMSSTPEASLLGTAAFRSAEAQAIARGIQRYLTTHDTGTGYRTPLPRGFSDDGGGRTDKCRDPALD